MTGIAACEEITEYDGCFNAKKMTAVNGIKIFLKKHTIKKKLFQIDASNQKSLSDFQTRFEFRFELGNDFTSRIETHAHPPPKLVHPLG